MSIWKRRLRLHFRHQYGKDQWCISEPVTGRSTGWFYYCKNAVSTAKVIFTKGG